MMAVSEFRATGHVISGNPAHRIFPARPRRRPNRPMFRLIGGEILRIRASSVAGRVDSALRPGEHRKVFPDPLYVGGVPRSLPVSPVLILGDMGRSGRPKVAARRAVFTTRLSVNGTR